MAVRDWLITLPDRWRLARYAARGYVEAFVLMLIDRYLDRLGQTRVLKPLDYDELPVLYDNVDLAADVSAWPE